jgi:hypothetical protein
VTTAGASGAGHRARRRLAALLVTLACLAGLISMIAVWAHGVVLNTDRYVATVGPILKNPTVQRSLGDFTADKVVEAVHLQDLIAGQLPSRLVLISGPVTDQVRAQLRESMVALFRSRTVYSIWIAVNRFAHRQLVAVLRNDSRYVAVNGDAVNLNLVPFIALGVSKLEAALPGSITRHLTLPKLDPAAAPDVQRAQLEAAVGRPLVRDFGQVTILRSGQVRTAQQAVRLFDALVWGLIGLTAALIALSLAVSVRRRRTLIQLCIGAVAAVVIARVAIHVVHDAIIRDLGSVGPIAALRTATDTVFASLTGFLSRLLIAGALVAALAYLAGRPPWLARATSVAGRVAGVVTRQGLGAQEPAALWVRSHRDGLRVCGVVVAVTTLFFTATSLGWSLAVVAALAVYEVCLALIGGRAGRRTRATG